MPCIMKAGGRGKIRVGMKGHGRRMKGHSSKLQLHALLQLLSTQAPYMIKLRSTSGPMAVTRLGNEHWCEQSQPTTSTPT